MSDVDKNSYNSLDDPEIDKELVARIKEIQDLPEEIIYKFINAAGSLSKTDFAKRFDNEK